MVVWNYVRQLIADGLRAAIRINQWPLQPTSTIPPSSIDWKSLTEADILSLVESQLADFASPRDYDLISIPHAVALGEKHGVCSFRISDEGGCSNQPYLCHKCSHDRGTQWEVCGVSQRETPQWRAWS